MPENRQIKVKTYSEKHIKSKQLIRPIQWLRKSLKQNGRQKIVYFA